MHVLVLFHDITTSRAMVSLLLPKPVALCLLILVGRIARQAELIRLRKLTFVSEKKLSAEASTRMKLEQR